jgi:hypothetical protein
MPIPLSQLMQSDDPDLGPPTATHDLCLSAKLFQDLQDATERYTDLEGRLDVARDEQRDPDRSRPAKRLGTKSDIKQLEADAEEAAAIADQIRDRMAERSVTLHLVVNEDVWTDLTREHPAREITDDVTGHHLDRRYTGGLCNVDKLIDEVLPKFIDRYGDEKPTAAFWEFARTNSARGDRYLAASRVVQLHTQGVDLGKSRTALRSSRRSSTDSE